MVSRFGSVQTELLPIVMHPTNFIDEFFSMHYGMSNVDVYGLILWCYSFGRKANSMKRGWQYKVEDHSWKKLGIPQRYTCFVSAYHNISQQNSCHKTYKEKCKNKVKDVPKDGNLGK